MRSVASIAVALALVVVLLPPTGGRAVAAASPWQKVYDRAAPYAQAIEMYDDRFGLADIGHGIQRTTDGGLTWSEPDPSVGIGGGHIAIADAHHAWIAGYSGVMLRTEDGGVTWTRQQTGTDAHFNAVAAVSDREAWATAYGTGFSDVGPFEHYDSVLLHTVDGGTWQPVRLSDYGIFFGVWSVGGDLWLLASPCHPGDPFRASPDGRPGCVDTYTLLQSSDGGRSWTPLAPPSLNGFSPLFVWADGRRGYGISRTCGPDGCRELLYATDDGGRSWQPRQPVSSGTSYVYGLRLMAPDEVWAIVSECSMAECHMRLAHTRDGARTWDFADMPGEAVAGVFDVTSTHVVASAPDTGIARYDLRARAWQPSVTDARPVLGSLQFVTAGRGYAVAGDGRLWQTDDGGATWSPGPAAPEPLNAVVAAGGTLWVTTHASGLYRSDDAGQSWTQAALPAGVDVSSGFGLQAADGRRAWLTLTHGLWRTDDGGATWRLLEDTFGGQYAFIDHDHGWTSSCATRYCDNAIRVTADGGATWDLRSVPESAYIQTFLTPSDGWGSVMEGRRSVGDTPCPCLVVTRDGGRSWQAWSTGPLSIGQLRFVDALRGWGIAYDLSVPYEPPSVVVTVDGGRTWTTELRLRGYSMGGFAAAPGRIWLTEGVTANPWTQGRTVIYRRDVPATPALVAPDTGRGGPGKADPPASVRLLVTGGLLLILTGGAFRRARRPA